MGHEGSGAWGTEARELEPWREVRLESPQGLGRWATWLPPGLDGPLRSSCCSPALHPPVRSQASVLAAPRPRRAFNPASAADPRDCRAGDPWTRGGLGHGGSPSPNHPPPYIHA